MWNTESIKVYLASFIGFSAPGANWCLDVAEPFVKLAVLLGQLGVAVATIVYISFKCRQLSKKRASRKKPK